MKALVAQANPANKEGESFRAANDHRPCHASVH